VPTLARALALLACCLPLALPAAAHGALTLSHVKAEAVEVPGQGNGDDVVGPGDRIHLRERIGTATALSGASGVLFTPTPGVSLDVNSSPYAAAPAGGQSTNTRPFEAVLGSNLSCGANLSFALSVDAAGGTGSPGPALTVNGAAQAIAQTGETAAKLTVPTAGRVKGMEVEIGSLTHPDLNDLRLEIVAPDGQSVVLAEAGTLHGTTMTGTVFGAGGYSITGALAPYTNRYAPAGDLGQLAGRALDGTWELRITDVAPGGGDGSLAAWSVAHRKAFCSGIPKAAFAMDADPPRINPGGTVKFDAAASADEGGSIKGYEWDLDGDGEFDDGTGPTAERTYPVRAKVPVALRVTDNDGLEDVETQTLAVTLPPTAKISATPTSPLTGETVRLSAAGSTDAEGGPLTYRWTVQDDEEPSRDTQGVDFLDTSFAQTGKKTVTVTVTDMDGAEATASMDIVVRNRPPVAAIAAPGRVDVGRPATLDASGSADPEKGPLGYHWNLDDKPDYETSSNGLPTLQHTFTEHGTKTVGLQVTDEHGATSTTTRTFVVTRPPVAVAQATPNPVSLRRDVTISAAGSNDPDQPGAALTYEWDVDGDADDDFAPGGLSVTTSWATAGTRTVKVRVTDPSGAKTVGTTDVVVRNMTPVAVLNAAPIAPKTGEATVLTATAMDPDGTVKRYQWDRDGDGQYELDTGHVPSATATFANAGNVTVGVRVTDDDDGIGTKTLVIAVAPSAPAGGDGGGAKPPGDAGATPPPGDGAGATPPGETPTQPAGELSPGDRFEPTAARPFGAWLGGAAIQRTSHVLARGLLISCRSELAVWCSVDATISARDAKKLKLGRKRTTLVKTALPVPEGQVVRTRLKLPAKARRALRGTSGIRVVVRAVARTADGREVALSRVVLLRG
jgi:PKD repeat protein